MRRYQGMRRQIVSVAMAAVFCVSGLAGCAQNGDGNGTSDSLKGSENTSGNASSTDSKDAGGKETGEDLQNIPVDGAKMQAKWLTIDDGGVEKKLTSLVGDTLYWAEWDYNIEEKKPENQKVSYMKAGGKKHEIFADDEVLLREFFVSADESKICYLYRTDDDAMGVEFDSLDKSSGQTTMLSTLDITDEKVLDELISNAVIDGVLDDDGVLWLLNSDNVLLKMGAEAESWQCEGDGLLELDSTVYVYDVDGSEFRLYNADGMSEAAVYDFEANGLIKNTNSVAEGGYVSRGDSVDIEVLGGDGSEFYVMCGDNVYTYTYNDTKLEVQSSISLEKSGMDNKNISQMGKNDNKYYVYADATDGGNLVVLVENLDDLKTKIELACISSFEKDLKTYVSTYNQYSDSYYIDIKSYDFRADRSQFNLDLIRGEAADCFLLNGVALNTLIGTNSLEELTPYYDASDSVSLDMLEDSVKRVCELDGGQYMVLNRFLVSGYLMKQEYASQMKDGALAIDDMYDILMKNPSMDISPDGFSKENMANYFINYLMPETDKFIDWENKTCSFDDGRFENLITHIYDIADSREYNELHDKYSSSYDDSAVAQMLYNDLCLYSRGVNITVEQYASQFKGAVLDMYDVVGYPGEFGHVYYRMTPTYMFGMNYNSDNKDGVWDFFEFVYSEQMQKTEGGFGGLMSNEFSPLKKYNEEIYDAALAGELSAQKTTSHYTNNYTGNSIEGAPVLDADDIAFIKNAVDNAYYDMDISNDGDIQSIIVEELNAYFAGNKSAKETADIIQGRIELYLGE